MASEQVVRAVTQQSENPVRMTFISGFSQGDKKICNNYLFFSDIWIQLQMSIQGWEGEEQKYPGQVDHHPPEYEKRREKCKNTRKEGAIGEKSGGN